MPVARKKIITISIWSITLLSVCVFSPFALARNIAPGVDFETQTTPRGKVMRAIIVNTQQAKVRVESKVTTSCNPKYTRAEIENMGNEPDMIAAINAHFFRSTVLGDFIGNQFYMGPVYPPSNRNPPHVAIDHSGGVVVGTGELSRDMASRFSMFLRGVFRIGGQGGRAFTEMTDADVTARFHSIYSSDESDAAGPIARTFLGVIPSQNKLILMTGGDGDSRTGVTPIEGVTYLKTLGATEAYVLDSGGSTLMRLNSRLAGEAGVMYRADRTIATVITVRTGRPQTTEEVQALPVRDCKGSASSSGTDARTDTATGVSAPSGPPPSAAAPPVSGGGTAVAVPAGAVPLEVPIGSVSSISGTGSVIVNYSQVLFAFLAGLVGLIALAMLIVSGLRIITGGAEQTTKAKQGIVGVLSGLILFASGGLLLYLINPCFFTFGQSAVCRERITSTGQQLQPSGGGFTGGAAPGGAPTTAGPDVASGAAPSEYRSSLPSVWGAGKRRDGIDRFNDFGVEFIRQSNIIFPGVPPELIMGFAMNGGKFENTTGFRTGLPDEHRPNPPAGIACAPVLREGQREFGSASLHQQFHEIGMFGVEGGPRCGPAPAPASVARSNNWAPVAQSAEVQTLLGRPGCMSPGCWYPPSGIPDQIAIGLVNTRNAGRNVMRQLPANLRATSENSLWFISLAFMGWSAGTGRAANHVEAFASQLAPVPENQRWGAFIRLLAERAQSGQLTCTPHTTHACPLYSAMRTLQKNEAGLILARERGGNVQFWEDGLGSERTQMFDTITRFGFMAHR